MESSLHEIFRKYVNDDCTEEEVGILLKYFSLSENDELLKELILREMESADDAIYQPSDTDVRLESVYRNIEKYISRDTRPVVRYNKFWLFSAAATILLLVMVGTYWIMHNEKVQPIAQVIQPGRDQAMLITGNGKSIKLNDIGAEAVQLENGGSIQKTANGQVVYQVPDKAVKGQKSEMNTLKTPVGGQWQVVLPDQTHVWLNASSSITYEVPFNQQERKIILSGEAYFEVSKHASQPFRVVCRDQELQVLGTSFNVTAYPEENIVRTTLINGAVVVNNGNKKVQLSPGQQAITDQKDIQVSTSIDTEEAVAWKNGFFKFNGNLESILSRIARWYDIEVIYENKPSSNEIFEGEISRSRGLEDVLHIIEYSGKVHFVVKGRTVIVK